MCRFLPLELSQRGLCTRQPSSRPPRSDLSGSPGATLPTTLKINIELRYRRSVVSSVKGRGAHVRSRGLELARSEVAFLAYGVSIRACAVLRFAIYSDIYVCTALSSTFESKIIQSKLNTETLFSPLSCLPAYLVTGGAG